MQKSSSNSFNLLGSKPFSFLTMAFWHCFVSWKQWVNLAIKNQISIVILCLWVLERCPDELFKDCHRQTPKPVVWTHSLAITPQPKGKIFSHRKRWMVSTGLKHHTIMWKQRFQHLKALFIHFMQFCGPWITHKKWHSNAFWSSFKMTKILVSNIFYHFLVPFHLAFWASTVSEKFRLDRKIGFQNTFYTKSINVIIDNIGPSIILRSIIQHRRRPQKQWWSYKNTAYWFLKHVD